MGFPARTTPRRSLASCSAALRRKLRRGEPLRLDGRVRARRPSAATRPRCCLARRTSTNRSPTTATRTVSSASRDRRTSFDRDRLPGEVLRVVGEQEARHGRDVERNAVALERDRSLGAGDRVGWRRCRRSSGCRCHRGRCSWRARRAARTASRRAASARRRRPCSRCSRVRSRGHGSRPSTRW